MYGATTTVNCSGGWQRRQLRDKDIQRRRVVMSQGTRCSRAERIFVRGQRLTLIVRGLRPLWINSRRARAAMLLFGVERVPGSTLSPCARLPQDSGI